MVDATTLDREAVPRGEAWFRTHFNGRLLADLRWLGNQYRILVLRLPERVSVAEMCCTEQAALARVRADRLVSESFPHDCDAAECGPWVPYTEG